MTYSFQAIGQYKESDQAKTLAARDYKDATDLILRGVGNLNTAVRRLTPKECERLQGFPDNWTLIGEYDPTTQERYYIDTNGKRKKVTDSARYKALGNSIALPFWRYLARRIMAQYEHEVTMGSLFDGIGGFPLVFSQCGCKPVWASEIEEFPIAVTKEHFPEAEDPKESRLQADTLLMEEVQNGGSD